MVLKNGCETRWPIATKPEREADADNHRHRNTDRDPINDRVAAPAEILEVFKGKV